MNELTPQSSIEPSIADRQAAMDQAYDLLPTILSMDGTINPYSIAAAMRAREQQVVDDTDESNREGGILVKLSRFAQRFSPIRSGQNHP